MCNGCSGCEEFEVGIAAIMGRGVRLLMERKLLWVIVGVLLVLSNVAYSCKVDGCQTCKAGFDDRCSLCKDGYDDQFAKDSFGVSIMTCKKVTSTGMILGLTLGGCALVLCIAVIALFYWIQLKRMIKRNIENYTRKRDELEQKRVQLEQERARSAPVINEYVRQRTDYEERIRRMKEVRDRLDELERRQQEEQMRAMQPPPPPPVYNIFMEMEKDYINKRTELERAQHMRLPPGFLDQHPLPPPIIPLTLETQQGSYNGQAGVSVSTNQVMPPQPNKYLPPGFEEANLKA